MITSKSRRASRLAIPAAAAALLASPLIPLSSASAAPADHVVINEAYVNGGSSGAQFDRKFVELYNPTDEPIDLSGMSLQYRSASRETNFTSVAPLTGSIEAGGYYLLSGGTNGDSGDPLPTPDATDTGFNTSGTHGTVALASSTEAISPPTGSVVDESDVVDLLGYGDSNTYETTPATSPDGTGDQRSMNRTDGADTDDNSADFALSGDVTPTNAAGESGGGDDGGGDGGPPTEHTIAQIQGTGDTSPYEDDPVITHGVVTAAYPTGGYDGFYLQTAGTGGDVDLSTHDASDGIFVYGSSTVGKVEIGDAVTVTGTVSEYEGMTELSPSSADDVVVSGDPAEAVKPATVDYPRQVAQRESLEGMLVDPQGAYTITDNYDTNYYGSIDLAAGTKPLIQPTEVADAQDTAAVQAVKDDNAARAVTLDDGSSTNFAVYTDNTDIALPYLTPGGQVRVGAAVDFNQPVILDYRFDAWSFQPTEHLTADNADRVQPATFEQTRTTAPEDVGGDVRLASFNVLNYFTTTGDDWGCTDFYTDREGNPITVGDCGEEGPRGAANDENLQRQQAKITAAINALDADVVSLEEIENSVKFDKNRDAALADLVAALNDDAGSDVWAYAPSPDAADLPPVAQQDVIRNAFIYRKAAVETVGTSHVLVGSAPFQNAREPLAQAFRPVGGSRQDPSADETAADTFIAITNHFKSKGSGVDDGTGQGNANPDRVAQAHALVDFANTMKSELGTDKVFLDGDFNAYTMEDPIQVLTDAGYTDLVSEYTDEHTYVYDGLVGSLDHVLASPAALETVSGADVWNVNSYEPVAYEYSRYNYNVLNFYDESPYRSSDHDPIVVGIESAEADKAPSWTHASTHTVRAGQDARVKVKVKPHDATGDVTVLRDGDVLGTATLGHKGRATVRVPTTDLGPGRYTLTVEYGGDAHTQASSTTVRLKVKHGHGHGHGHGGHGHGHGGHGH